MNNNKCIKCIHKAVCETANREKVQKMAETNFELPYEKIAMQGGEMPEGLTLTDQNMFLSLRSLYDNYRKGIVDRDTAIREKNRLIIEYKSSVLIDMVCRGWADQIKQTEMARAEYRKNRTLENADKLLASVEGVQIYG